MLCIVPGHEIMNLLNSNINLTRRNINGDLARIAFVVFSKVRFIGNWSSPPPYLVSSNEFLFTTLQNMVDDTDQCYKVPFFIVFECQEICSQHSFSRTII